MKIILFNIAHIIVAVIILLPILFATVYLIHKIEEHFKNVKDENK